MRLSFRTEEPVPGVYEVTAYDEGGEPAGHIRVGRRIWMTDAGIFAGPSVSHIHVREDLRRRRVATRLYEAASRIACHVWGEGLRSGVARTANADAFWRKQVLRGRADCLKRYERHCFQYQMACPAPSSLSGGVR